MPIPCESLIPFSEMDSKKIQDLLKRPYMERNKDLKEQVSMYLRFYGVQSDYNRAEKYLDHNSDVPAECMKGFLTNV